MVTSINSMPDPSPENRFKIVVETAADFLKIQKTEDTYFFPPDTFHTKFHVPKHWLTHHAEGNVSHATWNTARTLGSDEHPSALQYPFAVKIPSRSDNIALATEAAAFNRAGLGIAITQDGPFNELTIAEPLAEGPSLTRFIVLARYSKRMDDYASLPDTIRSRFSEFNRLGVVFRELVSEGSDEPFDHVIKAPFNVHTDTSKKIRLNFFDLSSCVILPPHDMLEDLKRYAEILKTGNVTRANKPENYTSLMRYELLAEQLRPKTLDESFQLLTRLSSELEQKLHARNPTTGKFEKEFNITNLTSLKSIPPRVQDEFDLQRFIQKIDDSIREQTDLIDEQNRQVDILLQSIGKCMKKSTPIPSILEV